MEEKSSTELYLKPGRLADVLALIQVLAYNEWVKRSNDGVLQELRKKPLSADTWVDIGAQHPELFRVLEPEEVGRKQSVALISRLFQPVAREATGSKPAQAEVLKADQTGKLMDLAVNLHDREIQRRDRWRIWLTAVPAMIAAVGGIVAAVASVVTVIRGSSPPPAQATSVGMPAQPAIPTAADPTKAQAAPPASQSPRK